MIGRVIGGSAVAGVMVRTPAGGSVMSNWIVSTTSAPLPLASVIACRNEPAPVSLVVVTVKVAAQPACAAGKPRSSPKIKILVFIDLASWRDHPVISWEYCYTLAGTEAPRRVCARSCESRVSYQKAVPTTRFFPLPEAIETPEVTCL